MKVLYDENLPKSLVRRLSDVFPDSVSIVDVDLGAKPVSDRRIWEFCRENGYVIVSKDYDFQQLAYLHGHPPKVVWLRCGNGPVTKIESALRRNLPEIAQFLQDATASFLVIR